MKNWTSSTKDKREEKMRVRFLIPMLWACLFSNLSIAQPTIECKQIGFFKEGLAPIQLRDDWGFLDVNGKIAIEPKFAVYIEEWGALPYFDEGMLVVLDTETEKCGYIDKQGKLVIPYKFTHAFNFSDGIAAIIQDSRVFSLINTEGKIIAEEIGWHDGGKFKNGLMRFQKEFQNGFMNKKGEVVIEPMFDAATDFCENVAFVQKDNRWGLIDASGKYIIEPKFKECPEPFSGERTFFIGSDYKRGIIDKEGKIISEPKYNHTFQFKDGFAVVSLNDSKNQQFFQIIDLNGKSVKEFPYTNKYKENVTFFSGFQEGLAIAMKDGKRGMLDTKGNTVIKFEFSVLEPFYSGLAYAEKFDDKNKKTKKGFINKKGEFVFFVNFI